MSFYFSLTNYSLGLEPAFIGLDNYIRLLSDPLFFTSLLNSLYFLLIMACIGVPTGLGLAILLNERFRGRTFARVCLLVPWATPAIVSATMFIYIFNSTYGIFNWSLLRLGIMKTTIPVLSTEEFALPTLVIITLWKTMPLFAFIFLSALQNLPVEIIESAKVYGATSVKRFFYIVLPFLRPVIAVVFILAGIFSIPVFDVIIGITVGGPGHATYTLYYYAYQLAFPRLNIGYGSAVAYIVTIIAFIFAYAILKLFYRR